MIDFDLLANVNQNIQIDQVLITKSRQINKIISS